MKIKALVLVLFCFYFTSVAAMAQLTGKIEKPELGMEFMIPDEWTGQETGEGILLASSSIPGFLFISVHEYESLAELEKEALQGIRDGISTNLSLNGSIEKIDANSLGLQYTGTLEGHPAKVYAIGIINKHGYGITILAATDPEKYTAQYKQLATNIASSFRFYEPKAAEVSAQWQQMLADMSLRRMSSYSSGTSGGSNSSTRIDLCSNGYFSYSSNSSMSIDVGGVFGNSSGSNNGTGQWKVLDGANGTGILELHFNDGRLWKYEVTINQKGETFLDGTRYFRLGKNDPNGYGPNCP
ncbi:MAG: hypothetical protein ACFCUU_14085 [Cyclobacteriaceae bacterium]